MSKREQVLNALDTLCKEEYGRGWNEARAIYGKGEGYSNGYVDGRKRGASDTQESFERELSERERIGYNKGYDLGHTDGYFKGRATMRTRIEDIVLNLKEEE